MEKAKNFGEYLEGQRRNGIGKKIFYHYNEYTENTDIFLFEYEYLNGDRLDSKFKIN